MPTYTYECKKCSHAFDIFHGISEKRRIKCERCKGPTTRLIGSGAGIIFKGSGFYETDYKRKSGTKDTAESKKESTKEKSTSTSESGDSKSSGTGDAKPSDGSKSSEGAKNKG